MIDELDTAATDRLADRLIQHMATRGAPLSSLGQSDALRDGLRTLLNGKSGFVSALGEICRITNPDWQEKREQQEWLTLDEVYAVSVRSYTA